MTNAPLQLEDLEKLTTEELEALAAEGDSADDKSNVNKTGDGSGDNKTIDDYKKEAEDAKKRAAILQRLLNKKNKTPTNETTTNSNSSLSAEDRKEIEEIKFRSKVERFAEDNGLTKAQAERVLRINPNATAETLKDPFIANGLKAIERKERIEDATPGAGKSTTVGGKSFKEMTREERIKNFGKFTGNEN